MNRSVFDPRVGGPVLVAALLFALREGHTLPPVVPATRPAVIELPAVHAANPPLRDQDFELDLERSTVRFAIASGDGLVLLGCTRCAGRLALRRDERRSQLSLDLDLASLTVLTPGADPGLLRELLGVRADSTLQCRADLVRTAGTALPGVRELLWDGAVRCDGRAVRQPMVLWQPTLPGQPMRLQGYGSVSTAPYHLPNPSWFGLSPAHVVTLGLDLVWRRAAPR